MAAVSKVVSKTLDSGVPVFNRNTGKWHYCPIVTTQIEAGHYTEGDADTAIAAIVEDGVVISAGAVTRNSATMSRVNDTDKFVIQSSEETTGPWAELTP